ncbi:hypothetical protein [Nostoc sp. UHCC 0870]|uniref:hypothetical protein n=1 Tax=Nostoc sp. UHCC 0870 TaxID=2914041 RepID=UPI001EDF1A56|nr:hypothetical protein [Nostoc sp. UHCC 0870]UKO98586.1 hypothetical protein L6494_02280 [Nostoc sp. UHCC 0870]
MARKHSLSDLIQEEAQKFTPSEGESAIEVTAQAVVEDAATPEEITQQTPEASATKRSTTTKADLEVTIKELQTSLAASQKSLAASQKNEKALQAQIVDLQSALAEQQASVEKVTKELFETKKTALQLAEANSQLIEESKSLQKEQESLIEASKSLKQEHAIQIQKQQEQKSFKPIVNYKKSHRSPEHMPVQQTDAQEDFSANTWLYD